MKNSILITGMACAMLTLSGAALAAEDERMQQSDMGEDESMTFERIDTDGDHSISREEAAVRDDLKANWEQIDSDSNNQLDISEFSAFEGKGRYTPPEASEIAEPGAAPYDPGMQ